MLIKFDNGETKTTQQFALEILKEGALARFSWCTEDNKRCALGVILQARYQLPFGRVYFDRFTDAKSLDMLLDAYSKKFGASIMQDNSNFIGSDNDRALFMANRIQTL